MLRLRYQNFSENAFWFITILSVCPIWKVNLKETLHKNEYSCRIELFFKSKDDVCLHSPQVCSALLSPAFPWAYEEHTAPRRSHVENFVEDSWNDFVFAFYPTTLFIVSHKFYFIPMNNLLCVFFNIVVKNHQ